MGPMDGLLDFLFTRKGRIWGGKKHSSLSKLLGKKYEKINVYCRQKLYNVTVVVWKIM